LDASACGETRNSSHDHAAVNPLNINAFARSTERRSGAFGRKFLAANGVGRSSEAVDRAPDAEWATVEDVCVHHHRAHVSVAQQLLHGADVVAMFQKMSRE
jgi:hypothetical protein